MDRSVFDYGRANERYRLKNVVDFANRLSRYPSELNGAVMAGDPGRKGE